MSAIDVLIAELCPDGVEYRKLGEICSKAKTIRWDDPNDSRFYIDLSSVDINTHIIGELERITADNAPSRAKQVVKENDLLFATTRPTQMRCCVIPALLDNQICSTGYCVLRFNDMSVDVRFAFHWLTTDRFKTYLENNQTEGNYPAISDKKLREFQIPVPPIEVQQEVVRILDAFAALSDELTAKLAEEVTARKQQYAHYRDRLLSRESLEALDGKPVEMKRLKDVGAFYGGLTGKSKEDFKEGGAPFVPYTNVYNNAAVDFRKLESVKVAGGERQHAIAYGDVLVTGSSETPDDCGMTSVVMQSPEVQTYLNSFCFGWRPNSLDAFEPGYLKYAFRAYGARRQIVKTANGVTRFNISKEAFGRVEIPVPSLETQQKVVDILDRFDALTTSLTDGLPAEIEARKAQYGYYRDRLLDFPRKEVAAS